MENKSGKYIKYAVGEIVLVVIGILIAVGINSRYSAAQNEYKIQAILIQVQQDLLTDILDAKRIYNVYIGKDSIFQKIMNDSITFERYKENPYPLPITGNYVSFSNKKGGYNRFMNNLENLPEKYNILLPHFNNLYFEIQNEIDDYNTQIKNTVIGQREDFKANPKMADYRLTKNRDEASEYFFKDPFLKNKSSIYMNDLGNIAEAANVYRVESILLYKKIDSLLGKTPMEYEEPLILLPKKSTIDSFLGDYSNQPIDSLGRASSLHRVNEQLVWKNVRFPDANLYWHEGDYYFIREAEVIFKLSKNNQNQHTIDISWSGNIRKKIKTEDL